MRLAVLGAGSWGTALAARLAHQHAVTLYGRDPALVEAMARTRENARYLPGIGLPEALHCTADFAHALRTAELVVIATPVAGLRAMCAALVPRAPIDLVWVCKGFEDETGLLPHAVVRSLLPHWHGASLSGPSFAREVAEGRPTALTVASEHVALQERVVSAFHLEALRVYRSDDVTGVEVGGAVKNVMAIATGISDGLQLGLNARAALVTRGLAEMMRLGEALGGRPETLMGLTGVGDLILTCTGDLSRNRRVGLALGQGEALAAVLARLGHVAEGVQCARTVRDLARAAGVEMPITEAVCAILFDGVPAESVVASLLARQPRAEV